MTKEDILDNRRSVLYSFRISTKEEELDPERKSSFSCLPIGWHNHRQNSVMFPVYGFRFMTFRPFGEHISQRGVVNTVMAMSYNVISHIIYEWGTCTGAIRRFMFEIVNIEILQHLLN
jgi:hypothetical protein